LIAADFTIERLKLVAPVAALVLKEVFSQENGSNQVIIGYDRRFLAETFAHKAAEAVQEAGFDVLLSQSYAPTPAFSWAAYQKKALGALVITASHNPGGYLGLKVKGAFGGSVGGEVTQQIEAKIWQSIAVSTSGTIQLFDAWESYCQALRSQVDMTQIQEAIDTGKLQVFADVMHGAAATGLGRLLGREIWEINANPDPLFDGAAPEPLPRYLSQLSRLIRTQKLKQPDRLRVGLVFDGDSDRIAAVDESGNFLSSQILIPILLEHLALRRGMTGEVIKTLSASDLIPRLANLYNLSVYETPVGYKYIADRMLTTKVLIGGEESGGIGYGHHIPERDALLSALYVLEALTQSNQNLSQLYHNLQTKANFYSAYDRIDLPLAGMEVRSRLLELLKNQPLTEIAGQSVVSSQSIDGYKFRLADGSWLMIRFSGTEPVLRLYSEAPNLEFVQRNLAWAEKWANQ
jgi:phosphomannomutase